MSCYPLDDIQSCVHGCGCTTGTGPRGGVIFHDGRRVVRVCEPCTTSWTCYYGPWRRPIYFGQGHGSAEWMMEGAHIPQPQRLLDAWQEAATR